MGANERNCSIAAWGSTIASKTPREKGVHMEKQLLTRACRKSSTDGRRTGSQDIRQHRRTSNFRDDHSDKLAQFGNT